MMNFYFALPVPSFATFLTGDDESLLEFGGALLVDPIERVLDFVGDTELLV